MTRPASNLKRLRRMHTHKPIAPGFENEAKLIDMKLELGINAVHAERPGLHLMIVASDVEAAERLAKARLRKVTASVSGKVLLLTLPQMAMVVRSIDVFLDLLGNSIERLIGMSDDSHVEFVSGSVRSVLHDETGADAWQRSLDHLARFRKKTGVGVILLIPDYDALMTNVFSSPKRESFFRNNMLQHTPGLMIVAISGGRKLDSNYESPVFQNFERVLLPERTPKDALRPMELQPTADACTTAQLAFIEAALAVFGVRERLIFVLCDAFMSAGNANPVHGFDAIEQLAQQALDRSAFRDAGTRTQGILTALATGYEPMVRTEIVNALDLSASDLSPYIAKLQMLDQIAPDQSRQCLIGRGRPKTPLSLTSRFLADGIASGNLSQTKDLDTAFASAPRRALLLLWSDILFGEQVAAAVRKLQGDEAEGESAFKKLDSLRATVSKKALRRFGKVVPDDWINLGIPLAFVLSALRTGLTDEFVVRSCLLVKASPLSRRLLRALVMTTRKFDPFTRLGESDTPVGIDHTDLAHIRKYLGFLDSASVKQ